MGADSGASPVITTVPVYTHDEDGLQTIAIDPEHAAAGTAMLFVALMFGQAVGATAITRLAAFTTAAIRRAVWICWAVTPCFFSSPSWASTRSTSFRTSRSPGW